MAILHPCQGNGVGSFTPSPSELVWLCSQTSRISSTAPESIRAVAKGDTLPTFLSSIVGASMDRKSLFTVLRKHSHFPRNLKKRAPSSDSVTIPSKREHALQPIITGWLRAASQELDFRESERVLSLVLSIFVGSRHASELVEDDADHVSEVLLKVSDSSSYIRLH